MRCEAPHTSAFSAAQAAGWDPPSNRFIYHDVLVRALRMQHASPVAVYRSFSLADGAMWTVIIDVFTFDRLNVPKKLMPK